MRKPLVVQFADDAHKWGKPEHVSRESARSIKELCDAAGIECRAFGHLTDYKMAALIAGTEHYLLIEDDGPFYSIGRDFIAEDAPEDVALRMLEILAYTFHEYAARECLYKQPLFVAPEGSYKSDSEKNKP